MGEDENRKVCEHEWEAVEIKHHGSHVELRRKKCGARKEIELFP